MIDIGDSLTATPKTQGATATAQTNQTHKDKTATAATVPERVAVVDSKISRPKMAMDASSTTSHPPTATTGTEEARVVSTTTSTTTTTAVRKEDAATTTTTAAALVRPVDPTSHVSVEQAAVVAKDGAASATTAATPIVAAAANAADGDKEGAPRNPNPDDDSKTRSQIQKKEEETSHRIGTTGTEDQDKATTLETGSATVAMAPPPLGITTTTPIAVANTTTTPTTILPLTVQQVPTTTTLVEDPIVAAAAAAAATANLPILPNPISNNNNNTVALSGTTSTAPASTTQQHVPADTGTDAATHGTHHNKDVDLSCFPYTVHLGKDVVSGKGGKVQQVNRHFRNLVAAEYPLYDSTSSKISKRKIGLSIYQQVIGSGGRFLDHDGNPMDQPKAVLKVMKGTTTTTTIWTTCGVLVCESRFEANF